MDNKKKKEVLEEAGRRLVEILQDNIIQEGLLKTGALARSVKYTITNDNNPTLDILMKDYGVYQDSGVSGTERSIAASPESLYSPGQFKSKVIGGPLPFQVRKSIAELGFRPRPFITKSYNQLMANYLDEAMMNAGEEDIDTTLTATFVKNGAILN
jgi:hypothetical protein